MVLKGTQNCDTMALKTLSSYFIASYCDLILCVVFVHVLTIVDIQIRKSRCYFTEAGGTRRHLRLPSVSVTLPLPSRCVVQKSGVCFVFYFTT